MVENLAQVSRLSSIRLQTESKAWAGTTDAEEDVQKLENGWRIPEVA